MLPQPSSTQGGIIIIISSIYAGPDNGAYWCATQVANIDEHDNDNNDVLDQVVTLDQVDADGKW